MIRTSYFAMVEIIRWRRNPLLRVQFAASLARSTIAKPTNLYVPCMMLVI